jgi:hypothetical protein
MGDNESNTMAGAHMSHGYPAPLPAERERAPQPETQQVRFPQILEIWAAGENNTIGIVRKGPNGVLYFRVTAWRNVRSESSCIYLASYEMQVRLRDPASTEPIFIWRDVTHFFSATDGSTPEECLELSLEYLDSLPGRARSLTA